MAEPKPREKFWVTDPPATFDDEENGTVLICVFSNRRLLKAFYESQGIENPAERHMQIRRYRKLKTDCHRLGWNGLAIDPDPETGNCRIIRFDGVAGIGGAVEDETVGLEDAKDVAPPPKPKSTILTEGLGFIPSR
jgi:hypothetical protein